MRVPGWRALGAFWAVVLLATGGTVLRLNELGPPEVSTSQVPAEAPATVTEATRPSAEPSRIGAPQLPPVADAARNGASPSGDSMATAPAAPAAATPPPPAPAAGAPSPPAPVVSAPAAPEPPPLASASLPSRAADRPIPPPDPALLDQGRHGMLPRLGPEGRTSIRAYGRDFDRRDTRPRIGIVVADVGLSATQTEEAIRRLPPAVALALSPYAARPGQAAERARERGMETLISIPMEPAGYPLNDPGDRALLTGRPMAENLDLLDWVLSRSQGYVGAIGAIGGMRGERFAALPETIGPVQDVLFRRGLLYLDPRPGAAAPARAWGRGIDVILDEPAGTRGEIERRLAELEQIARDRGAALGLAGAATPVLVERLAAWAATLDQRGLVLAPVSAMIRRPEATTPDTPAQRPAAP